MKSFHLLVVLCTVLCLSSCDDDSGDTTPDNALPGERAQFLFDGNTSDGMGNFANATVNGATLTTDRKGNPNSAYAFDGIDDYLEIPNSASLLDDAFTISIWVEIARPDRFFRSIINKELDYQLTVQEIVFSSGNLTTFQPRLTYFVGRNETATPWNNFFVLFNSPTPTWRHIAMSYDQGELKLYIDGDLSATQDGLNQMIDNTNQTVLIGAKRNQSNPSEIVNYFEGSIDDFRYFSRALTLTEIQELTADQ